VSYTQYGQPNYEAGIAHGGPIVDGVLGFRASVWYRYDGGWINWEYTSRNPWRAPVQDPNSSQFNPNSYTLPSTSFTSLRTGIKLGG
jgi:hypothetical protein